MRECVLVLNQSLLQQNIHMILSPDSMLKRRENKCSSGHYGQTLQSKFYQATGNYVQKIKISFPWVHLQTILAFDVSFVFIKFIFTLSFSPALGLIHIVLNFVFWFVCHRCCLKIHAKLCIQSGSIQRRRTSSCSLPKLFKDILMYVKFWTWRK